MSYHHCMIKGIGERIRRLREQMGISQTTLAKEFNCHYTAVSKWENETRFPTLEDLVILSKFFNVTTDYLLGLQDL